uniref:uncharacterized protein LOC122601239 n=1 Tax=Erigeron canadensis TaxID=72917 RepID=UPI001CB902A3|nr:uncharacterized protein LOC122601239 [Erigeron canadensis]
MRDSDDNIQNYYSNWVDNNASSDHNNRYHEGSSTNARIFSCLDQTTDNNYNLHLRPQGDSPIGLNLRKSKSLLNLVEMTLSKEKEKKSQPTTTPEKLKASNFPALLLQIGSWKRISRNEGELVAKLYYAKKKLVWEFLDGPLKNKIEIQWSEISAIRAYIYEGHHGRLEIELNQPPQFGREINPQPRKHTQWKQTTDFTEGQASVYRRHSVIFPAGVLDKHYEKLLQCDNRLFDLSKHPFPINNYPYFYHDPNHYVHYSCANAHIHPYTHAGDPDSNSVTSVAPFQYIKESSTRHTNKNHERGSNQFELIISATSTGIEDQFIPYHRQEPWTQVRQTTSLHEEIYSTGNEVSYGYGTAESNSWVGMTDVYGLPWERGMYENQDYDPNWT